MTNILRLALIAACAVMALPRLATAQATTAVPPAITTPDKVETSIGTLEYTNGAPSKETVAQAYDYLDLTTQYPLRRTVIGQL